MHITRFTEELMTTEHEQPTKLTYPNETKHTDPTKVDYTIRLVLAPTDDSDKENNGPDIQWFNIAEPLEYWDERTTNITRPSSRATSNSDAHDQSNGEIWGSTNHRRLLSEVPETRAMKSYRSFDHLRTTDEVSERITQFACSSGTIIMTNDNRWLSTLWILLKDIHLVSTLIRQARIIFNYQCADLSKHLSIFPEDNQCLQEEQSNSLDLISYDAS